MSRIASKSSNRDYLETWIQWTHEALEHTAGRFRSTKQKKWCTEALTSMIQFQISPNSTICRNYRSTDPQPSSQHTNLSKPVSLQIDWVRRFDKQNMWRVATTFQTSRWVGEGHNAILPLFHMHWLLPGKIRMSSHQVINQKGVSIHVSWSYRLTK